PVFDDGGAFRGALDMFSDLTDRRRAEEALKEADRRKDEFLAMLAHELRNPLGPIRNAAEVLGLKRPVEPTLARASEMIERQVVHMARLIDDLLDVSRISRGKVLLRKECCDLARVARETAGDYRPNLAQAGLRLVADVPAGPVWVEGDPTRLAQVL